MLYNEYLCGFLEIVQLYDVSIVVLKMSVWSSCNTKEANAPLVNPFYHIYNLSNESFYIVSLHTNAESIRCPGDKQIFHLRFSLY